MSQPRVTDSRVSGPARTRLHSPGGSAPLMEGHSFPSGRLDHGKSPAAFGNAGWPGRPRRQHPFQSARTARRSRRRLPSARQDPPARLIPPPPNARTAVPGRVGLGLRNLHVPGTCIGWQWFAGAAERRKSLARVVRPGSLERDKKELLEPGKGDTSEPWPSRTVALAGLEEGGVAGASKVPGSHDPGYVLSPLRGLMECGATRVKTALNCLANSLSSWFRSQRPGHAAEDQRAFLPQQNLYFSPLSHGHGA